MPNWSEEVFIISKIQNTVPWTYTSSTVPLTTEKMYSMDFTVPHKKICLSLPYNGSNSYLFVNGKEIIKFKAKDSIVARPLCLDNISKGWTSSNMKKTGLSEYVYEFNVDYSNNNTKNAIPFVHKYLMSNYDIV